MRETFCWNLLSNDEVGGWWVLSAAGYLPSSDWFWQCVSISARLILIESWMAFNCLQGWGVDSIFNVFLLFHHLKKSNGKKDDKSSKSLYFLLYEFKICVLSLELGLRIPPEGVDSLNSAPSQSAPLVRSQVEEDKKKLPRRMCVYWKSLVAECSASWILSDGYFFTLLSAEKFIRANGGTAAIARFHQRAWRKAAVCVFYG